MKIYGSTEYIEDSKVGDLKLEVNSMWNFSSRNVCFEKIGNTTIAYDLKECFEVIDKKTHHTKWKQAEINDEILKQLENNGYKINPNLIN